MTVEHFALAGGLTATVTTDAPLRFSGNDRRQLRAFVPDVRTLPSLSGRPDISIDHRDSTNVSLIQRGACVEFHDLWGDKLPPDFFHLFYGAARRAWIERSICPVHAACVGQGDGSYVLLVGHSGAGKTSIALECLHSEGMRAFSGGKTLLRLQPDGSIDAIGGTTTFTLRMEDARRWPQLSWPHLEGLPESDRVMLDLTPRYTAQTSTVPIRAIALVRLNDGVAECRRLFWLSALHTLYPYALDTERADIVLAGGGAVFDGGISQEKKSELARALRRSLQSVPAYHLSGSRQRVAAMVRAIGRGEPESIDTPS